MPRGRQQELRLWLPPALYERVLRDAAVRGVSLSRCVRDRLEAHLALEEELLDVVEKKDARHDHGAAGAALRLRLGDYDCALDTTGKDAFDALHGPLQRIPGAFELSDDGKEVEYVRFTPLGETVLFERE